MYSAFCLMILELTALMVIITNNTVHAVFYLILVYFLTAVLFMILGAEFMSVLLVLVYVGAVCMLFLFVVMMLEISILDQWSLFYNYLPLSFLVSLIMFLIFLITGSSTLSQTLVGYLFNAQVMDHMFYTSAVSNIFNLSLMFLNHYFHLLVFSALPLLASMIGSIVLVVTLVSAVSNNVMVSVSERMQNLSQPW